MKCFSCKAIDTIADAAVLAVTFLLPLKFGNLAVMPEMSVGLPDGFFTAMIVSWTAHLFGMVGGGLLLLMLLTCPPRPGIMRGGVAVTALLWGVGLTVATLPGWINSPLVDYAQGETAHLAAIGAYVTAIWLWLADRPARRGWFFGALAAGTFCTGLSGLRQYFFGFDEMKEYLAGELAAGRSIPLPLQAKILDTRVFATFVSCNALAGYLLLTIPLAVLGFYRFGKRFEPTVLSARLMGGVCAATLVAVLLMTRSRGAFLAALVTSGGWAVMRPLSKRRKIILLALVAAVIAAGGLYIQLRGRGFLSAGERFEYAATSLRMIVERPLDGHGWGGFFKRNMQLKTSDTDESARDPHNLLFAFASQAGVPAGLLVLVALVVPLWCLWRQERSGRADLPTQAVFWGGLAFFMHALIDIDLQIPADMAAAGAMLVAALSGGRAASEERRVNWPVWMLAAVIGFVSLGMNYRWLRGETAQNDLVSSLSERKVTQVEIDGMLRRAVVARPNSPFVWESAGDLFLESGNIEQAERCFERSRELAGWRPAIHRRFFDLALRRGDRDAARREVAEMLRLFPSNPHYRKLAVEYGIALPE